MPERKPKGITRIQIVSDWSDRRTRMATNLAPLANDLYLAMFERIGLPLEDGLEVIECTKQEALSRYDWREGIDVILHFRNGTKATLQEKFLNYSESTATFEEKKSSGKDGAWYYCTAQYYFVAYARQYPRIQEQFDDWVLLDLPALHRADAVGDIRWIFNYNKKEGRQGTFRYVLFSDIPEHCVVAAPVKEDQIAATF